MLSRLCSFVAATIVVCSTSFVNAEVYSLQLGAFKDHQAAQRAISELSDRITATEVHNSEQGEFPFKIVYGAFETYVEAFIAKENLSQDISSFIITRDVEDKPFSTTQLKSVPFDLATLGQAGQPLKENQELRLVNKPTTAVLTKDSGLMDKQELLSVGIHAQSNKQGVPALQAFISKYPEDPLCNEVCLRLSRRLMGRSDFEGAEQAITSVQKNGSPDEKAEAMLLKAYLVMYRDGNDDAYEHFRQIACDSNCNDAVRRDAMRMAAGSAHANGDLGKAFLAFKQIEETAISVDSKAEACLQQIGIVFELAGRGKGSWSEVREYAQRLQGIHDAPRSCRATSELMIAETYFFEGDYSKCLKAMEAYLISYSDIPRESSVAQTWIGICYVNLNDLAAAQKVFSEVLDVKLEKSEKFARLEPRAKSAYWLAWIATQNGDAEERDHYLEILASEFPESTEAKEATLLANSPVPSSISIQQKDQK